MPERKNVDALHLDLMLFLVDWLPQIQLVKRSGKTVSVVKATVTVTEAPGAERLMAKIVAGVIAKVVAEVPLVIALIKIQSKISVNKSNSIENRHRVKAIKKTMKGGRWTRLQSILIMVALKKLAQKDEGVADKASACAETVEVVHALSVLPPSFNIKIIWIFQTCPSFWEVTQMLLRLPRRRP